MVVKAQTISREKIGQVIGRLNDENLVAVNRALAVFPGFA
jgi:mRNA interferase MazF